MRIGYGIQVYACFQLEEYLFTFEMEQNFILMNETIASLLFLSNFTPKE